MSFLLPCVRDQFNRYRERLGLQQKRIEELESAINCFLQAELAKVRCEEIPKGREMSVLNNDELIKRFTYHPPKADQPSRYQKLRDEAKSLAELMANLCPDSRERSLALTKLEEAVMWANASIARNE